MTTTILRALFLATFLRSVWAAEGKTHPVFIPDFDPALTALVLYALSGICHWIQFFRIGNNRWMLPLPIGMTTMAIGFAVRMLVHHSPTSFGLNIATTLLILLSPCLFLALDYMILGRLAGLFGPDVAKRSMLISPARVATIFVCSDVCTFIIQAIGGAMITSSKINTINLGNKIVIAGLSVQLVSFGLFTTLTLVFGLRVRKLFPHVWHVTGETRFVTVPFGKGPVADWHILYYILCLSCVAILIRSIFRMAEFIQGHTGYISTHEPFFYWFDAVPLWIAMTIYALVWPPRFLNTPREAQAMELRKPLGAAQTGNGGSNIPDL
ncbi:RTA1 like protein-domain-containing protein [Mycena capillaripes]|nr:RTA1 like protein-domain-containing protein [Mycena capillaripes]